VDYQKKIDNLKRKVTEMLRERNSNSTEEDGQATSQIWSEALGVLDYALNLSAENFRNIRLHTSWFSGEHVGAYWHMYPPVDPAKYANALGYEFYVSQIPETYWLGEPRVPGLSIPLGLDYKDKIINKPITRYQRCISNLYLMGILQQLLNKAGNSIVLEIGAGHGGFAHSLGNILAGKSTYIIVDLPEMLLFSGGFLTVNNPEKNIYVYDKSTFTPEFLSSRVYEYDYVLAPNYALAGLCALPEIDLMVNLLSFPEMTRKQLDEYLQLGYSKVSGYLCSDNMDRHPFSDQLGTDTVTSMLYDRFHLFPPPRLYDEPVSNSYWQTRFYVGISRKKEGHFPDQGRIRHMIGKKKLEFCFGGQSVPA
jgi:hypothetical protein